MTLVFIILCGIAGAMLLNLQIHGPRLTLNEVSPGEAAAYIFIGWYTLCLVAFAIMNAIDAFTQRVVENQEPAPEHF
jgi:hypothetical protein